MFFNENQVIKMEKINILILLFIIFNAFLELTENYWI